jgi:2-polyprenyl-3-methyl-5-hydroxy-6-metoxy-1,4-benzoquinol methylase
MKSLFKERSSKKELLDAANIPFADIALNMKELDTINSRLGGHAVTIAGLKKILSQHYLKDKKIKIVEIGCGGGDNLRVIKNWAAANGIQVELSGVDINNECITFAKENPENEGIRFIASEYSKMIFADPPAIIFSSLFCHHFTNDQLVYMMKWMQRSCTFGFFINDLHRHRLAYYSIKGITKYFSKSYLVKNDAPVSVLRGFKRKELENIIAMAGLKNYSIEWKWAFRWLVTFNHE